MRSITRAKVLHHDVRGLQQFFQGFDTGRRLQVDSRARLERLDEIKVDVIPARVAPREPNRRLKFNLDDVRTLIRQHHGRHGARYHTGEVDDADTGQRSQLLLFVIDHSRYATGGLPIGFFQRRLCPLVVGLAIGCSTHLIHHQHLPRQLVACRMIRRESHDVVLTDAGAITQRRDSDHTFTKPLVGQANDQTVLYQS